MAGLEQLVNECHHERPDAEQGSSSACFMRTIGASSESADLHEASRHR
jgi:hypothetical protein